MSDNPRILVVDDDSHFRKRLSRALSAKGYAVRAVARGKTALKRVSEQPPSVAVIDFKLRDMPALELMRQIKDQSPNSECIVLTGYASQDAVIEAEDLGAYNCVVKPCDVGQLLVSIRRAAEKVETERALRECKGKLELVFESAGEGIVFLDAKGTIRELNASALKMTGLEGEEVIGTHFAELLPRLGLDVPATVRLVKDRMQGGPRRGPELTLTTKRGREVTILAHATPVSKDGKTVGLWVILDDITERRWAEKALRESEERYRTLFDRVPVGLYRTTPDGQILDANPAYVQMIGYPDVESLRQVNVSELYVDPEERRGWQALIERDGVVRDFEVRGRLRDGTIIWARDNGRAIRDAEGKVLYYEGSVEDITERKCAEEALRESEERLRSIFDNAVLGLYRTTPDGRIVMANPAVVEMLGYSSFDELAERNLEEEGYEPEYPRSVFKRRIEEDGQVVGLESAWTRRDGSTLFVRESARAIRDQGGNTLYYEGTVEDISERKRAEEALRQRNQELVALNVIAETVSQSLDLAEMLRSALDKLLEITRVEAGGIYLADEATRRLTLMAHRGVSKEFVAQVGDISIDQEVAERPRELGPTDKSIAATELLIEDRAFLSSMAKAIVREKLRSYLRVLIRVKGRPAGLLVVASHRPRSFTAGEKELLSTIANQIGVAIENARLYQERQRRLTEMTALYETSLDLVGQLELPALLSSVVERASGLLGTAASGVWLYHPEDEELELVTAYGAPEGYEGRRLDLGEGLAGRVAQTGMGLMLTDYAQWEGRSMKYGDAPITSILGAPLKWGDETIGVITVNEVEKRRAFDEHDLRLLSLLANQAVVAIQNARLFEQVQARSKYLETLQRINATLRSTLPLQEVLDEIVQGTTQALGYIGTALAVPDVTGERLVLGAVSGGRLLDTALKLGGRALDAFSLPLTSEDNLMVRAFLSGRLQASSGEPEGLAFGTEPSISPRVARAMERAMGARSAVCVPLAVSDKIVGVLIAMSPRERLAGEERSMLLGLADQAGLAIQNARLFEQVQARSEYLETLQKINETLRSTMPVSQVLDTIVSGATEAFGYAGALISVPDDAGERLVFGAGRGGRFLDASMKLTGHAPQSYSLPLKFEENPIVRAFLTGEVHAWSKDAKSIVVGVEPSIRPKVARAIQRAMGAASAACIPLRVGAKAVGVLTVMSPRGQFDEDELTMLLGLANQAALAMETARLHEETTRRAEELATLYDVSLEVAGELGLAPLLDTVVDRAIDLLGGFAGGLYTYSAETQELELIAAQWPGGDVGDVRLALREGVCGRVVERGEPLVVTDYANWQGRPAQFDGGPSFNVLAVPVKRGDVLLGALYVNDQNVERRFGEADVRLATLFANQAAIAIENARLYEETGRRAEELATLYDISLEVVATTDLAEVLSTVVEKAALLLDADSGGVYLFDPEAEVLDLGVSYGYEMDYTGLRFVLGEGLAGKVAESREPLIVDDYSSWAGQSPQWEGETLLGALGVPLLRGDELLGVLFIDRWRPGRFDDHDLRVASLFANQAAIAIENAQLLDAVREHQNDLQRLSAQLIRAQEEERRRISQELHDQLGQALTAMSINLAAVEKELRWDLDASTRERLAETDSLIDETLDQMRDLSLELRPSMLDDLGLLPALRWYVTRYTKRADIEVEFEAIGLDERLSPELETVLYRVVQESLTNVARHAGARRVHVRLDRREATVGALIEDDGQGFDLEDVRGREPHERGAGLLGMRERIASVGGSLRIESAPGQGTRLVVEMPLEARDFSS